MAAPPDPRKLLAKFDDTGIIMYQAFASEVAIPAVQNQSLKGVSAFSTSRMTWFKLSWPHAM